MTRLFWLAALTAAVLQADDTIVYKMKDDKNTASWKMQYKSEDKVKITMKDGDNSMTYFILDGHRYMVNAQPGEKPTVIDMDEMGALIKSMGMDKAFSGYGAATAEQANPTYTRTGKTRTVAGYKGEIWIVEYTDADKKRQRDEIVVTDDDDIYRSVNRFFKTLASMVPGTEPFYDSITKLPDEHVWIAAEGGELDSFSDAHIDDGIYALPKDAQVQSFGNLGALLSGAAARDEADDEAIADDEPAMEEEPMTEATAEAEPESAEEDDTVNRVIKGIFDSLF